MTSKILTISDFKAKCLGYLKETLKSKASFTITLRGKPIAKVIPIEESLQNKVVLGSQKGSMEILCNMEEFIHTDFSDDWNALK